MPFHLPPAGPDLFCTFHIPQVAISASQEFAGKLESISFVLFEARIYKAWVREAESKLKSADQPAPPSPGPGPSEAAETSTKAEEPAAAPAEAATSVEVCFFQPTQRAWLYP